MATDEALGRGIPIQRERGITRLLKLTWPSLRSGPRSLTPVVGQTWTHWCESRLESEVAQLHR
jgi:hypothetical protein